MTLEKAIELKAAVGRLMYSDNKDIRDFNALIEFIDASLRPVNQEQVKKGWRGEWKMCSNNKGICSECHKQDGIDPLAKFCRYCGAPMTDEAVQMVMERMEVLKNAD